MSQPSITVEHVGKRYSLGTTGAGAQLSERLGTFLRAPIGRGTERGACSPETFWALKDVSLTINPGEVVGLVGANGAGKSTLLKILSRITWPTEGRAEIRGRVGSLLEVGTGFHPELTGRENIFLNGAILGMRKREIEAKFDEIVDFSGVARFLDTPVKRYSSGMFVRLAFGVAAHLEPEILLVDEVLAVGDADFQRKCLGKMQEVSRGGRTVVFVSHNMTSVRRLCTRAYLIEAGRIASEGATGEVVDAYLHRTEVDSMDGEVVLTEVNRVGTGAGRIIRVALLVDGRPADTVPFGSRFTLRLTLDIAKPIAEGVIQIGISTPDGLRVLTSNSIDVNTPPVRLEGGTHVLEAHFDVTLLPGEFTVDLGLLDSAGATLDWVERALRFKAGAVSRDGREHYPWAVVRGHVRPAVTWAAVDHPDASVVAGRA